MFDLKDCEYITIQGIADMESLITAPPKAKKKELCKYEQDTAGGTELEKTEYNKYFNQFEELHKKTNYVSTYDESIYTTELNVNKLTPAQIDKAMKLSSEIEKSVTHPNESENEERDFSQVIREPVVAKKEDEVSLKKMLESVICKDINITTGPLNAEATANPEAPVIPPSNNEALLNADVPIPQDANKMSGISTDEFAYEAQEIKLFREKREHSPTNYKYRKRHSLEQTIGNLNIEVPKIDKELMQKYRRFRADKNIPDKESFINFSKNYKMRPFRSASKEEAKLLPIPNASEINKEVTPQEKDPLQSEQTLKQPVVEENSQIKALPLNTPVVNKEPKKEEEKKDLRREEKVDIKKEEAKRVELAMQRAEVKEAKKPSELRVDAKPYVPSFTNIQQAPATSIGIMPVNIVYYDPNQMQPPVGAQIYGYNYGYTPYQPNYQYSYNYPTTDYYADPNINKYKK